MNHRVVCVTLIFVAVLCLADVFAESDERWINPRCTPLECTKNGPFIQFDDGSLMVVDRNRLSTSKDGGKTWSEPGPIIAPGMNVEHPGHVGQLLRTRDGTIVIVYVDFTDRFFSWSEEKLAPNPGCKLELWVIRSTDGGKTWTDRQRLLDGYNTDFMGLIQTRDGNVVTAVGHLDFEGAHWVTYSFVSKDDGKTWRRSNVIDLGGRGHHDGADEPSLAELSDGRLMMLIRTSLGQFWKAISTDGGHHWRIIKPSGINASSAPGWLLRLKSGRLVFAWNQFKAGPAWWGKRFERAAFEFPASSHREELSIAFSDDDGQTWTEPVVIARQPGGQLCYPYILERKPGELWVFTRYSFYKGGVDEKGVAKTGKPAPPLAVRLMEADFAECL
jgi:sialidase-1